MKTIGDRKRYEYMLFYPADWLHDIALNACSLEAQGAWVRLMCHMHDSEKYGYLVVNGEALDLKGIKNLSKLPDEQFDRIWEELTKRNVVKKDKESGAYFSKRMVNDYKKHNPQFIDEIDQDNKEIIEDIIKYLNKKANKDLEIDNVNFIMLINNKLLQGYNQSQIKKVIDIKTAEWLNDLTMNKYLTPNTLFGPKFSNYVNQEKPVIKNKPTEISDLNKKIIESVIKYLNKKTNKNFELNNIKYIILINNKLNEGYTELQLKKVIDIKTEHWLDDSTYNIHLNPTTLFGNNFSDYINQESKKPMPPKNTTNPYKNMM